MKHQHSHHRGAKWLPADPDVHSAWLSRVIKEARRQSGELHPVVEEFRRFIETDPQAYMLFHQIFDDAARRPPSMRVLARRPGSGTTTACCASSISCSPARRNMIAAAWSAPPSRPCSTS